MSDCIFCTILAEQAPASRVYQDKHCVAFMDIRPVRRGQLLVIPRQHIDHFCDLPDELAAHIMLVGQRIARGLRTLFSPRRVGMIVHGFGVPHAHLIVLPLEHAADITSSANACIEGGMVKFKYEQVALANRNELDQVAGELSAVLA